MSRVATIEQYVEDMSRESIFMLIERTPKESMRAWQRVIEGRFDALDLVRLRKCFVRAGIPEDLIEDEGSLRLFVTALTNRIMSRR